MKKSIILLFSITILITGMIISIYNTSTQKAKNALQDVKEPNGYLNDDNQGYLDEIEHYKIEATSKIESNSQNLAVFKGKIDTQKEDYIQSVLELEIQNSNMKKKLDEYIPEGIDKWEKFKTEFSNEMDELDKEVKDFTKLI